MTNYHKEDFKYFIDIIKDPKKSSKKKRHNGAKKIFYVWFSRAKKWLCYAVCDDCIIEEDELLLESYGREINKDLTIE